MLSFQFCLHRLFCLCCFCSSLALNAHFSIVDGVLAMELYPVFWDVLIPGAPQYFQKLPQTRVLVLLSFS